MTVMKPLDKTLVRKLAVVLVIKLAVLVALWWGFVREQRVTVDTNSVAAQFLQSTPIPAKGLPQ
ncbi:cytochrome oxidase putative small subunit CydP [Rhodoferax sp.]|uniref:cytochrome oxidase putative small subunit CydP n=1 Tax=Rhodoferax sp. TaxID=50421 RepID=UPI0025DCD9F1|nr:cytochrome oxidase putative small subunit CydP [Rhodoferax sp.]